MTKVGRNDPCPCGSGKKHKKCCLGKGEQNLEKQPIFQLLTYEEVNELHTDKIIEELRNIGIPFSKAAFLEEVNQYYSADDLSENWFDTYTVTAKGKYEDFPWHAATVLWERLAPESNVSAEKMVHLLEKGHDYVRENQSIAACDTWLTLWEILKARVKPVYTNLDFMNEQYKRFFSIRNFVQDLEMEFHNAGLADPIYFQHRISFCREFCNYFPNESELMIHNMKRAIVESYAQLKQYEEAEKECMKLVEDYPNNPWSYIGWGDIYFIDQRKNYPKAHELYLKALEIADDEEDIEIIKERVKDLEKVLN